MDKFKLMWMGILPETIEVTMTNTETNSIEKINEFDVGDDDKIDPWFLEIADNDSDDDLDEDNNSDDDRKPKAK